MWNLSPACFHNYREHLDIAFPINDDGGVTEAVKGQILQLYTLYEQSKGRPNTALQGGGVSDELQGKVKDAYGLVQDGRSLSDLRSALKLLSHICPYCGYGPVLELDHYLQKAHYKLLSIFPLNLIPSCSECNRGKSRKPSTNSAKHQVHVYLEDVSHFDFFRAKVSVDANSGALNVFFFIEKCAGMTDDLFQRLEHHLIEFNLQDRYAKQVNTFLSTQITALEMVYASGGGDGVREFLTLTAGKLGGLLGVNDWQVALVRALHLSDEFCNGGFKKALGY